MIANKTFGTALAAGAVALVLLLGTSMTQAADDVIENGNVINPGITGLLLSDESSPDVVQVFVTSGTFDGNFGDQAGGIGEINQQCVWGGQFRHVAGELQHNWNGTQRFGHAAHAGRFLADQTVPAAQILIRAPGLHPADA